MRFFLGRLRGRIILIVIATLLFSSCHRKMSPEEKQLRHDLRHALTQHSYREAEILARRLLQFAPNDNGAWDRLVQAQCGQGDYKGTKRTFTDWRSTRARLPRNSTNTSATSPWRRKTPPLPYKRGIDCWENPHNLRVLIKVARVEQQQHHWLEADTAWTAALQAKETAEGLTQRALCRRHLHHWPEALADLQRAKEMAPEHPDVTQCALLFDRLE